MQRMFYIITAVFLAIWLGVTISPSLEAVRPAPKAVNNVSLLPLTDLADYSQWFQQQTGYAPDAAYFGAYALAPISDTLYVGFGAARPAEFDGALLAQSDGVTVTAVSTLSEQGFIDMTIVSDTLVIPGADPCCGDGWELGNTYVYTSAPILTKYRNLPDVIHSWGLWLDAADDVWYTAVSFSPAGGDGGGVFSSANQAQSWTLIADLNSGVGQDRTYDITGQHDKLYITWSDVADNPCGLAVSEDNGQTWTRLAGLQTMCRPRLFSFQDNLLALKADRSALVAIDAAGTAVTHTFPGFQVMDWAYNYLAADGDGWLYTITDDGRVMRTADLAAWQTVADTQLDLITLAYWPQKNWLVLSDRGSDAQLWRLDLTSLPSQPEAKYIVLLIADGWGANQIAAANAYAGAAPPYQSWPQTWMSTFPAGGSYDSDLAWTDFNYLKSGTTDSAAAATALYTGVKTANGRIAVNENDTARLTTISEKARALGLAAGAVTTVYSSHATPGAWIGHNSARGNGYAIADEGLWGDPNTTGTITDSPYYDGGYGPTRPPVDVLIGAGHPNWHGDRYVNDAIRDKLFAESGQPGAFTFVERLAGSADGGARLLAAANLSTTTRLAGLFGGVNGNLEYRLADGSGHDPENPTLAEMTTAALTTLTRAPNGFVLMVEGGAVDWAGHVNNMDFMIGEMIGFNEAVQAVIDWVDAPGNDSDWANTLVIVTGDHETGYLTAAPGVFPNQSLGAITTATLSLEKVVASAGRRASWEDGNGNDEIDAGEAVYWAWNSGSHSNSLIPLYAQGAGAELLVSHVAGTDSVRGDYVDNTAVFQVMDAVLPQSKQFLPIILNAPSQ